MRKYRHLARHKTGGRRALDHLAQRLPRAFHPREACPRHPPDDANSAEEKTRIVLEGLRGEENISELCRREGIAASMYYGWSKEFLEAGKRRPAGDTAPQRPAR
jgi:hypothetical protein